MTVKYNKPVGWRNDNWRHYLAAKHGSAGGKHYYAWQWQKPSRGDPGKILLALDKEERAKDMWHPEYSWGMPDVAKSAMSKGWKKPKGRVGRVVIDDYDAANKTYGKDMPEIAEAEAARRNVNYWSASGDKDYSKGEYDWEETGAPYEEKKLYAKSGKSRAKEPKPAKEVMDSVKKATKVLQF